MEMQAGRWRVRLGQEAGAALALRARLFRAGGTDRDAFDAGALHLTVEGPDGPAACARLTVQDGPAALRGYTAQSYDLTRFAAAFARLVEVGRIGFAPGPLDPDVPRLLLAAMARLVVAEQAAVLYGCASFPADGTGMARLRGRAAPEGWRPGPKAPETVALPDRPGPLPPLLRSWLALGAGVSDHAVRDRDLGTMHVFTALPVAAIPPARAAALTGLLDAA
ncbi:GNAT family N-acyltransferase [Jannaschia ovalis]|uniref:GNAT family N-acyltransferase n=1 Tax=Jannaschia ovalis TaxID=3038773 RepID=A0ABY8LFM0_9RHOB|nr:GNAT family N-acyltransferase [Jannaschia sp. GRR-S6-38]WGH78959.1 GNAT family N-acyltransferase [Jannaschia sp. GRR-S6-38]